MATDKTLIDGSAYEGIITKIKAGMVLVPKDEGDHAYNDACKRAVDIIKKYQKGTGLFQQSSSSIRIDRVIHLMKDKKTRD